MDPVRRRPCARCHSCWRPLRSFESRVALDVRGFAKGCPRSAERACSAGLASACPARPAHTPKHSHTATRPTAATALCRFSPPPAIPIYTPSSFVRVSRLHSLSEARWSHSWCHPPHLCVPHQSQPPSAVRLPALCRAQPGRLLSIHRSDRQCGLATPACHSWSGWAHRCALVCASVHSAVAQVRCGAQLPQRRPHQARSTCALMRRPSHCWPFLHLLPLVDCATPLAAGWLHTRVQATVSSTQHALPPLCLPRCLSLFPSLPRCQLPCTLPAHSLSIRRPCSVRLLVPLHSLPSLYAILPSACTAWGSRLSL